MHQHPPHASAAELVAPAHSPTSCVLAASCTRPLSRLHASSPVPVFSLVHPLVRAANLGFM
ncbi:hypothetical protein DENSPDRAFT_845952 [Dentipellis sp. KUC8613]|nr:hypothetical protein DENSPDRAFT_845952 [Dentipellis sp. KUC8613]